MAKIKLNGDTSGYIEISAPAVSGNNTLELGPGTKILTNLDNTFTGVSTFSNGLNVTGGNVLVGTTDATIYNNGDSDSEGIVLRDGEVIDIARKGDLQLTLNRQTNDGPHIGFFRSGSPKTYISTRNDAFCIDTGGLNERLRITSDGNLLIGSDTGSVHGNRLLQVGKTDRSETYVSIVSSTSGESGLLFADTTTNDTGGYRGQIRYHHSDDSMNFRTGATERVRITSGGHLVVGSGYADFQSGTRGESSSTDPYKLVFQNQYSNGYTDEKLKLYLFNSGATRQGFGPGPSYDLQYHCSGGTNQAKHRFYTDNVLRMEIADAHGAISKPTQPSFHATNTTVGQINTDLYGIIVFNDVTNSGNHNIGNHYNASTGVFTAPIAGRYLICARSLTNSAANSNPYVSIFVRLNGNIIAYLGHNHTDSWLMESYSGVLSLAANDTVDVYVNQASAHGGQYYSSFSGHLLS